MIQIERADNGWILIDHSDTENIRKHVFQETDDFNHEKSEAEAFARLLWAVKSIMGPMDSRYSEHRVYIEIKPGDKHSSHPDNQETEDDLSTDASEL
jgi:hypothetical protein